MLEGKKVLGYLLVRGLVILIIISYMAGIYAVYEEYLNGEYFSLIIITLAILLIILLNNGSPLKSASIGKKHLVAFVSYLLLIIIIIHLVKEKGEEITAVITISPIIYGLGYGIKCWIYNEEEEKI